MLNQIKLKAYLVFGLVHAGLILSIYGLVRASEFIPKGLALHWLIAGVALFYAGFLFAALSIYLPVRPWLSRANRLRQWRQWILQELPTILALIPIVLQAIQILKSAWKEVKSYKAQGQLDMKHLSKVARDLAEKAEALAEEPPVEPAKEKLRSKRAA